MREAARQEERMKSYRVLTREDYDLDEALEALQQEVTAALAEGWEPVGGISITFLQQQSHTFLVAQAMSKNEQPASISDLSQ